MREPPDVPAADAASSARDGPRERLHAAGADRLATADLVAVVMGGPRAEGRVDGARRALAAAGSLRRLAAATAAELARLPGLGRAGADRLAAAFALARRLHAEDVTRGRRLRSSADLFRHFHASLRDLRKERFLSVLLDAKNRILREEVVSEGSLTASIVHPREVFASAIRESAGAVVLVHNHPSGDPEPSVEDVEITRRLAQVGELCGIRVLDHLVVGDGRFVSFLDRGLL